MDIPNIPDSSMPRGPFRCPKELDILPPRPVLFPWLPKKGIGDCCNMQTNQSKFTFDDLEGGPSVTKDLSSQDEPSTPVTLPLSPSELSSSSTPPSKLHIPSSSASTSSDDDYLDAIPDMASVDTSYSNHTHQSSFQKQQKELVSFESIVAEILKVIFFILNMKQSLLLNGGKGDRRVFASPKKTKDVQPPLAIQESV